MRLLPALLLLAACWGSDAHIVKGVVVKVDGSDVVIDHEAIPSLGMGAMVMPFHVRDPALLQGLEPGDTVLARFQVDEQGGYLANIRETGRGPVPSVVEDGPAPVRVGGTLPSVELTLEDGTTTTVGAGQGVPTALTFVYTTCPVPEFCPAAMAKLGALQQQIAPPARAIAVTIDPEHDTVGVLDAFAAASGLDRSKVHLARAADLDTLAIRAALSVSRAGGGIEHGTRWLVLDADGVVLERYDDNRFPLDRLVSQLTTGEPKAALGSGGTVTPR